MRSTLARGPEIGAILPARAVFTKRVSDPFDARRLAAEQHDVETRSPLACVCQVMSGRSDKPAALGAGNALGRAAKLLRPARSHLDEHEGRSAFGHEVDLPETTTVVSGKDLQSAALQECRSEGLGSITPVAHRGAPAACGSVIVTIP